MRVVILIGYLVGSMFSLTVDLGEETSIVTTASVTPSTEANESNEAIETAEANETTEAIETVEANAMKQLQQQFKLQTVNGISLYDDPGRVIAKIGEPDFITEDEHFKDIMIFQYPGMNVLFSDEILYCVEILEGVQTLLVDDISITATVEDLKAELGEPDFITEDGIVFERDEALLKIFIDADSNKLNSISYFHRGTE